MNTTRETVEPAMRAAADDVCGDYSEIVPADTRNLMGFYISLRKLLVEVMISSEKGKDRDSSRSTDVVVVWHK